MALKLSIDLSTATFADLAGLIAAAKRAGATGETVLELVDNQLTVSVDVTDNDERDERYHRYRRETPLSEDRNDLYDAGKHFADTVRSTANQGTDAALRLIEELLRGDDRRY